MVLDGVEDFVDGDPERSELLYGVVGSERTLVRGLSLEGWLTPIPILGMGGGLVWRRRHHHASRSGCRKSSLPPPTRCRAELGIELRSSE